MNGGIRVTHSYCVRLQVCLTGCIHRSKVVSAALRQQMQCVKHNCGKAVDHMEKEHLQSRTTTKK